MIFYWSLSESKSPQVSRTLLSILAVLNNPVVWMVSTRPPTSNSSSPFSNPIIIIINIIYFIDYTTHTGIHLTAVDAKVYNFLSFLLISVDWGCRIHRLHLCRGIKTQPVNILDSQAPILELWRMYCSDLLLLRLGNISLKGTIYGSHRTV